MTDDKKFRMFENLDWSKLEDSNDFVGDAIKTVAKQGGSAGAILDHALGLTGSEGEAFSEAVKSYSNAYNPIFDKIINALKDDNVRSELINRFANKHKAVMASRNKKDK